MSDWLGKTFPAFPRMFSLGDRSQVHNIQRKEFSVIMVGVITTARTILRYWKSAKPEMSEWVNYMTNTASYESMPTRMTDRNHTERPV